MNELKIYDLKYWCEHIEFKACNIIKFNLTFIKINYIDTILKKYCKINLLYYL